MASTLIFYAIVVVLILYIQLMISYKQRKGTDETVLKFITGGKSHWVLQTLISIFWFPILVAFGVFLLVKKDN